MFHFGLKGDIQLNKPQQLNFELIYRFNIIATTEHNIHQLLCVQSWYTYSIKVKTPYI